MPDLEDTHEGEPDTPVDGAQGATDTETPPWGDDFKPEKAWSTITKQRESEKELKEELRRIREDETIRAELLQEWGYEVADDEDDSFEEAEEEDPNAPIVEKLTQLEQWRVDQEAKEADALIRTDLDAINEGSDWELDDEDRQWIVDKAAKNPKGFDKTALKQAHEAYIERLETRAAKAVERAKKPKPKAPHVTTGGKAATGTKSILDMTPQEHKEWARQRLLDMRKEG